MITKNDYEKQVRDADKRIMELDAQETELKKRQSQLKVDQLNEAARIRHELDEIQGKRSDLKLLRDIAQEQLDKWQKGMVKAKPLIEANMTAHERGRQNGVKLIKIQEETRTIVKDQDQVNVILSTNAKQFEELTGESMDCTLSMLYPPAESFAHAQIQEYDKWTYRSETELKEAHKAELDKKLEQHEVRVKVAEKHAPPCPQCGMKMVVDKRSGHADSPGQAGSGHSSHHWHFICPKCGQRETAPIPETKEK